LTLKQALWSEGFRIDANEHECSKAFRNFVNRLNREVYGASFRKGKKRLRVIPVREKDAEKRFHYHVAIELPAHVRHPVVDSELRRDAAYGSALFLIFSTAVLMH
jgi:hypothetical protein